MKHRIWDLHVHLSGVSGLTPEERAGQLLRYADRLGMEKLVVYMGMKWSQDPAPADLRQQNDEGLRAIKAHPDRLLGFVYCSAHHIKESLEELERCVADGPMVGVKLWVARRCASGEIDPLIQRAAELKGTAAVNNGAWFAATAPVRRTVADCNGCAEAVSTMTTCWTAPVGVQVAV